MRRILLWAQGPLFSLLDAGATSQNGHGQLIGVRGIFNTKSGCISDDVYFCRFVYTKFESVSFI